jgi:radical SAM superfamily enzyme YgiQ (UPF0313 family)
MKSKVLLVKPPELSPFNFGTFSLGVLGVAVRHLADVSIFDATDIPVSQAAAEVWSRRPDLLGVTVMGLNSVRPATDFIRCLKDGVGDNKNTPVIVGGHGASMMPAPLLQAGADAAVIGEGELTFQQIIENGIQAGAPGVACLVENNLVIGPPQTLIHPLDLLSPPARDLMPSPPNGIHLMETSRGCPHACTFCETTRFYGRRWRPYSPRWVLAEVKRLVDDYDAWIIHFADDNFAASPNRVRTICQGLQNEMLPAFFMVSARADDLVADPNLLPDMAAARILRITVGVETLDRETASEVGKPIPRQTYEEAFRRMRELGIFSVASFIVGLPGEDPVVREQSVKLAVEVGPDSAHFLPFLPLPGIPLALGHSGFDPDPTAVRDAYEFDQAFFQHQLVQARLKEAAASDGIRGLLARATLENRSRS